MLCKEKDYFIENKKNAAWEAVLTGLRVLKQYDLLCKKENY